MRVRKEEVKKVHEKGGGLEEKDLRLVGRARASHTTVAISSLCLSANLLSP